MSLQSIARNNFGGRALVLSFGRSAVMGRVGRKASLAALAAVYESSVMLYDTRARMALRSLCKNRSPLWAPLKRKEKPR
jgi:hypothetical protein